ncbi:MAG: hypothetical protein ABEI74_02885 [Candidatus Pacearchaeota archaeon]
MNKKIQKAKKEIRELAKKYPEEIDFAYIYGSSIDKKDPHDIDVMIIAEDREFQKREVMQEIDKKRKELQNKHEDVFIHVQSVQPLSNWWKLILKGEPWVIDSLRNCLIVIDNEKTLKEVSELVKRNSTFKRKELAENLIKRSQDNFLENKNILLRGITDLSEAATEALQLLLIFNDKVIVDKKRIIKEVENNFSKKISKPNINTYKEIIDLEEKMIKGSLNEFTAENLEYYEGKVSSLIGNVEKSIKTQG